MSKVAMNDAHISSTVSGSHQKIPSYFCTYSLVSASSRNQWYKVTKSQGSEIGVI